MVHASRGFLKPAAPELKSEPAIVAGMAKATLGEGPIDWDWLVADYDRIREAIEAVFPDFADFNTRVRQKGGFRPTVGASGRVWNTPSGKACFHVHPLRPSGPDALILTTVRSHDQYNTTIYGMDDRYRGITGRRDVIFANADDLAERGLAHGDKVDLVAGPGRRLAGFTLVAHAIARGSLAAYYPEANCLVALEDRDRASGTPNYKSIPVTLERSEGG